MPQQLLKKQYIQALSGLIGLALLGLIGIQWYWIDNAVTLRKADFHKQANEALAVVADVLDRQETAEHVLSQVRGKYLQVQSEAIGYW